MIVLKVVKNMKLNGKPILTGEYIRTNNPALFLQRGYATNLSKEEIRAILDEYVKSAERLLAEVLPKKEVALNIPKKAVDQGVLF